MAENWTFTQAKVETATQVAKQRAADHWRNKQWNLWTNFGTAQQDVNPGWVDPYFENEWTYLLNDPTTTPANLVTINAYFVYCWYKYKGYQDYVIAALLYSHTIESKITGALWESLRGAMAMHPFPGNAGNWLNVVNGVGSADYTNLKTFNPLLSAASYQWYLGYQIAPARSVYHADWSYDDGATIGTQLVGYAEAGSYDAVREMNGVDMNFVSQRAISTPEGIRTYYCWTNPNARRYTYYKSSFGYGLVQWTLWSELRSLCGWLSGSFKSTRDSSYIPGYDPQTATYYSCGPEWWTSTGNIRLQGFAHYHWQLNMTLQLMVLEFQRANAMKASPVAHPEYTQPPLNLENGLQWSERESEGEGRYYGGWEDNAAKGAKWNPATGGSPYEYGVACSWDEWASGEYLTKPGVNANLLAEIEADPNPPYRKTRLAMDILRKCYLRSAFNFPNPEILDYWLDCIEYWKDVWDIADIPRPREFPWLGFELDYYHQQKEDTMLLLAGRRKPHARRAILF